MVMGSGSRIGSGGFGGMKNTESSGWVYAERKKRRGIGNGIGTGTVSGGVNLGWE
jgi:hypothetical protein